MYFSEYCRFYLVNTIITFIFTTTVITTIITSNNLTYITMDNKNLTALKAKMDNEQVRDTRKDYAKPPVKKPAHINFLANTSHSTKLPAHLRDVVFQLRNNSEIRRFTSIGIINYLTEQGELNGNNKSVIFYWNKFAVKCDGLIREYNYSSPVFIKCFAASIPSIASYIQDKIEDFCEAELNKSLDEVCTNEELSAIVLSNIAHHQAVTAKINAEEDDDNEE